MFNVTVIKGKDLIKILLVVITIYIFSRFILKKISVNEFFNYKVNINICEFSKLGINTESNIIKNISKYNQENEKTEDVEEWAKKNSTEYILRVGSNLFKTKEQGKNEEIKEQQPKANISEEENKQEISQTNEIITDTNVQSKVVTQSPIAERYNKEYNGIKIKNETSYEITNEIFNTEDLNINTKNIIIFHTHTCESYTQSENYTYEPSRKL